MGQGKELNLPERVTYGRIGFFRDNQGNLQYVSITSEKLKVIKQNIRSN